MPKVTEAHLESRRDQILGAAHKCFARNGFHQTTMQDIFKEAGLSAGAVYNYFSSKEDIIEATSQKWKERRAASFLRLGEKDKRLEELLNLFAAYLQDITKPESQDRIRLGVQLWGEALRNSRIQHSMRTTWDVFLEGVMNTIRTAQGKGEIAPNLDAEASARLLLAIYYGLMLQKIIYSELDVARIEKVIRGFFRGELSTEGAKKTCCSDVR